jgi:hypothetical protein
MEQGSMGKYDKLGWHLAKLKSNRVGYHFEELEKILGFPLPKSARLHRPWWANDKTHVQASDGWLDYGWVVDSVEMDDQVVEFLKSGKEEKKQANMRNKSLSAKSNITPTEFETITRAAMSEYYEKKLFPGKISPVPKLFDMISDDKTIVGDAKYMTMVRGRYSPPAKFSVIAEHVWLLEKIEAKSKFLVFGNDRKVPTEWLKRYGKLVGNVDFFFYDVTNNQLEKLNDD